MAKNIVICCDGTGNEFGESKSNVVKLYKMLVHDPSQVAYYHPGVPLPTPGEFEQVIMIAVGDRRDGWVGLSSWPQRLEASPRLESANHPRERNGALPRVHAVVCAKIA